jgi:hypothetical protein
MPSGSRLKSKRAVPPSPIGPGLRSMGFSPILPGHAAETGFGRVLGLADDCRRAGAGDCRDLPVGVWVRRLGWMVAQLAVFGGLSYLLVNEYEPNKADAVGAAMVFSLVLTLLIFGIINQIQNWLIRKRARRIRPRVGLADEPDHDSDGLGRIGSRPQDPLEIAEIPFGEKPGKLLRPPS